MKIFIKKSLGNLYIKAEIVNDNTTINLGLLDEDERRELAKQFLQAAAKLLYGLPEKTEEEG